jgi:hypothetical protein
MSWLLLLQPKIRGIKAVSDDAAVALIIKFYWLKDYQQRSKSVYFYFYFTYALER